MYVRDRSVVFLSFVSRADTWYVHVSCAQRDIGPKCGEGCSRSPDLRGTYSVNIYSAEAVARIHQHAEGSSPWLIYLAYQSIHEPLQAPAEYARRYSETPGWADWSQGQKTISMMLASLDDGVKNISAALATTDQVDNTLIVLCVVR
jgi:arylsulfatase B